MTSEHMVSKAEDGLSKILPSNSKTLLSVCRRYLNLQCITSNLDIDKLKSLKVAQVIDEKDGDEDDGCDGVFDVLCDKWKQMWW